MNLAERKRKFRQTEYWCSLEISGIGFVALLFYLWVIVMLFTVFPWNRPNKSISVDLARTPHALKMSGALREDAMEIVVLRDGSVYFRNDKVSVNQIPEKISKSVALGAEPKVYVKADWRTKYRNVNEILDAIHQAGIERVGLITEQPREVLEP